MNKRADIADYLASRVDWADGEQGVWVTTEILEAAVALLRRAEPTHSGDVEALVGRIQDELERSYLAGADMPGSEPPPQFGCIPMFRANIAALRTRTQEPREEKP